MGNECLLEKERITREEVKEALEFASEQTIRNLSEFTEKFQNAYSENGFY